MYTILLVTHSCVVLFLIIMVLIQRTDSDGLGGLGGGGGNQFMTGRAAANLLTKTTSILAGIFMLSSLVLDVMASRMTNHSIVDSIKTEESRPVEKASEPANIAPVKPQSQEPTPAAKGQPASTTPTVPKPE